MIPKGQPATITIDNCEGGLQTLTGLATTHHTNLTIYEQKLVTHHAEDANAESSTENMDVETFRKIESPSSHDIINEHASNCVKSDQIQSFFWSLFSRIRTTYRRFTE